MPEANCGNCRFWKCNGEVPGTGECHRYAPVPFIAKNSHELASLVTWWPDTHSDEFCGEYQSKPEQPRTVTDAFGTREIDPKDAGSFDDYRNPPLENRPLM
jgi:hypothetical protein